MSASRLDTSLTRQLLPSRQSISRFIHVVIPHPHKMQVNTSCARFQVLTTASVKIRVFWDVPPCSLVGSRPTFQRSSGDKEMMNPTWIQGPTSQKTLHLIKAYFFKTYHRKNVNTLHWRALLFLQLRSSYSCLVCVVAHIYVTISMLWTGYLA
jgi:hypothetical protein